MGVVEWSALVALVTVLLALGGAVARLMDRLNKAEAKALTAVDSAAIATARVTLLQSELVEHRVSVAREYISRDTLVAMKSELVGAINRLGDRLDKLFQHVST